MRPIERAATAAFAGGVRLRAAIRRNPRLERLFYRALNRSNYASLDTHDILLADGVRLAAYRRGIEANVGAGDTVIDLGTGSGVLACLAARAGARRVHAIDHNPVVLARALARLNGLDSIEFHRAHSADFDPGGRVDAIVHHQMGIGIFNERMVSDIAELRDRVLAPGGRILPNRIDAYFEPAELEPDAHVPLVWEHEVEGLDFSLLREPALRAGGYPAARPIARSDHFRRLLCEPEPAFTIDLERHGPGDLPREVRFARESVVDGEQHGIAVYFVAHFDGENSVTNAPLAERTHWWPALLRTERRTRRRGETIEFHMTADDLERADTWRWDPAA